MKTKCTLFPANAWRISTRRMPDQPMNQPMKQALKKVLICGMIAFSTLIAKSAHADGHEGHGATIYDCSTRVSIPAFKGKVVLADFALPYLFHGLRGKIVIPKTNMTSVNEQIVANLHRVELVDEDIYQRLLAEIMRIKSAAYDPKNYYWGLTNDLGELPQLSPENSCELKNLIFYNTQTDIEKNGTLLARMRTNTDRAGVWVHEGVYSFTRQYGGQTDATVARLITALIFSKVEHPELLSRMVKGFLRKEYNVPPIDQHIYLNPDLFALPRQIILPSCLLQNYIPKFGENTWQTFWVDADHADDNTDTLNLGQSIANATLRQTAVTQYEISVANSAEIRLNVSFQNEFQFMWESTAPDLPAKCLPALAVGGKIVATGLSFDALLVFTGEENGVKARQIYQKNYNDLPSRQRASPLVDRYLQNWID